MFFMCFFCVYRVFFVCYMFKMFLLFNHTQHIYKQQRCENVRSLRSGGSRGPRARGTRRAGWARRKTYRRLRNTPPGNYRHWTTSFQSTKLRAGEQFLLLGCRASDRRKGVFLSQTPVGPQGRRSSATGLRSSPPCLTPLCTGRNSRLGDESQVSWRGGPLRARQRTKTKQLDLEGPKGAGLSSHTWRYNSVAGCRSQRQVM